MIEEYLDRRLRGGEQDRPPSAWPLWLPRDWRLRRKGGRRSQVCFISPLGHVVYNRRRVLALTGQGGKSPRVRKAPYKRGPPTEAQLANKRGRRTKAELLLREQQGVPAAPRRPARRGPLRVKAEARPKKRTRAVVTRIVALGVMRKLRAARQEPTSARVFLSPTGTAGDEGPDPFCFRQEALRAKVERPRLARAAKDEDSCPGTSTAKARPGALWPAGYYPATSSHRVGRGKSRLGLRPDWLPARWDVALKDTEAGTRSFIISPAGQVFDRPVAALKFLRSGRTGDTPLAKAKVKAEATAEAKRAIRPVSPKVPKLSDHDVAGHIDTNEQSNEPINFPCQVSDGDLEEV